MTHFFHSPEFGIFALLTYYLFSAAAGAMLAPLPGQERTRYGYLFRFVQLLAANGHRLSDKLPGFVRDMAAEAKPTPQRKPMNWIVNLFKHLLPFLKTGEEKALEDFESKLTPEVVNLAKDSVAAVTSLGLSDTAARDAAIAKMKEDAHTFGVDFVDWAKNELNALVELVYIPVKATTPASAPAEPAASTAS